ncbi:MAG: hypothetical protein ACP5F8_01600 [Candidatus Aenigmatarchaeota archaeon]
MPTITIYVVENLKPENEIIKSINEGSKDEKEWLSVTKNKNFKNELIISYFFEESIEEHLKNLLEEDSLEEVISILKQNGNGKVIKRVLCFLNLKSGILEVHRGPDKITQRIIHKLSEITGMKFIPLKLSPENLEKIYKEHSLELRQAMFKNVEGLFYQILRGNNLETNKRFLEYISKFKNCLRVISIRPAIKFLNGGKYQITINGDKGTVKFSSTSDFKWRPRFEIRQIIQMVTGVKNESLFRY